MNKMLNDINIIKEEKISRLKNKIENKIDGINNDYKKIEEKYNNIKYISHTYDFDTSEVSMTTNIGNIDLSYRLGNHLFYRCDKESNVLCPNAIFDLGIYKEMDVPDIMVDYLDKEFYKNYYKGIDRKGKNKDEKITEEQELLNILLNLIDDLDANVKFETNNKGWEYYGSEQCDPSELYESSKIFDENKYKQDTSGTYQIFDKISGNVTKIFTNFGTIVVSYYLWGYETDGYGLDLFNDDNELVYSAPNDYTAHRSHLLCGKRHIEEIYQWYKDNVKGDTV